MKTWSFWEFTGKAAALPTLPCYRWFSVGVRRQSRSPAPTLYLRCWVSVGVRRSEAAALLALPVSASQHWRLADSAWEFAGKAAAPPQHCIFVVGSVWEFAGKSRSPPLLTWPVSAGQHWRLAGKVAAPPMLPWVFFCPITSCRVAAN